ncbi:hypothetical protein BBJ28_00023280 [Nothophytophthora sp. Chile5]|nr:hypothetical protein BBJ28_00023280 [Nothophytophthora sp. Chile5]
MRLDGRAHNSTGLQRRTRLSDQEPMSSTSGFRHRQLDCHQGDSAANDRASYAARQVAELDALSAIGAVVNACEGRGVARFARCEATRSLWLRTMERTLLERHLTRVLRFSPSVEAVSEHFRGGEWDELAAEGEGLDVYKSLLSHTVFALMRTHAQSDDELREAARRPERLVGKLYVAKQQALPMLVSWLLSGSREGEREEGESDSEEAKAFEQLLLDDEPQGKAKSELLTLRLSVHDQLAITRAFVTRFLLALATQVPSAGSPMATHIPESFVCEGEDEGDCYDLPLLQVELQELWTSYAATRRSKGGPIEGSLCDLMDPSLRCRVYSDSDSDSDSDGDGDEDAQALGTTAANARQQRLPPRCHRGFSAIGCGRVPSANIHGTSLRPSPARKRPTKFQWLPTDFHVGADGHVTMLASSPLHGSVHPHHFPRLYESVPTLLGRLLPLFELALASISAESPPLPFRIGVGAAASRLECKSGTAAAGNSTQLDGVPSLPTPFSLRGRQIQVVMKLSTVRLDAHHPTFSGRHDEERWNRGWQLDGDNHERIVAVGYHVLRSRNVSPPQLAFRAFAHWPNTPEAPANTTQEDAFLAFGEKTSGYFGGSYGRLFLQPWGSLALHERRSLVVPSFLPHRLEPFALLDAADPDGGELTLLTFFLVDPTRRPVASARTVRPAQRQQTRRFVQANAEMLRQDLVAATQLHLPDELVRHIGDLAACEVSDDEALAARQQLLESRRRLQALRFLAPSLRLGELKLDLPGAHSQTAIRPQNSVLASRRSARIFPRASRVLAVGCSAQKKQ